MFIPVILGTARAGRVSERAAQFVHRIVSKQQDINTELVDVREHVKEAATKPPWGEGGADEQPTEWKEIVDRADGLILVTPEYNHGYPGELKLLLDTLYDSYTHKPVGLCGVSSGGLGGARVVEHIKPVLIELGLMPTQSAVYFSKAKETFSTDAETADPELEKRVTRMLGELLVLAKGFQNIRSTSVS